MSITISATEGSGVAFQLANGTKFVGSQTAGASGNFTLFWAPGGIRIVFTGMAARYVDGRQFQRIGIWPDVEIRPTIAGMRAGKDEVLERAVTYLRNGR